MINKIIILLLSILKSSNSFTSFSASIPFKRIESNVNHPFLQTKNTANIRQLQLSNESNNDESKITQENFDGKGFANYLAPYALTLLVSIAATALFVKFVLMDY